MRNRAVFLDRDGTINVDKGYLYRIEDFEFIAGSIKALKMLYDAGFKLIVISNQSGIARGLYTEEDYYILKSWMLEQLNSYDIKIEDTYFCPHLPESACGCRKPLTGLFHKGAMEHDIDLDRSYAIGDRLRDLSICNESACHGFLIHDTEDDSVISRVRKGKYPNISYSEDLYSAALSIIQ